MQLPMCQVLPVQPYLDGLLCCGLKELFDRRVCVCVCELGTNSERVLSCGKQAIGRALKLYR